MACSERRCSRWSATHDEVTTVRYALVTPKKLLERGSGVDKKIDFLNRCSDGWSETADAKISSKHNRFDIHMLNLEVGWIKDDPFILVRWMD
jgi:hypothetical protein